MEAEPLLLSFKIIFRPHSLTKKSLTLQPVIVKPALREDMNSAEHKVMLISSPWLAVNPISIFAVLLF